MTHVWHFGTPVYLGERLKLYKLIIGTDIDCKELHRKYAKVEIRSVERGICPIAKSTMTELFL